jgi:hypothetical protein
MTWLLAVIFRPLGSLLVFGFAALVAYKVIGPLIPEGRIKALLYDRSIRRNHPWKFAVAALVSCYGVLGLMLWHYS